MQVKPQIEEVEVPEIKSDPYEGRKVIFEPNHGPLTEFLASSEREVLYGGSKEVGSHMQC